MAIRFFADLATFPGGQPRLEKSPSTARPFSGGEQTDATWAKFGGGVALFGGLDAGGLEGFAPALELAADR